MKVLHYVDESRLAWGETWLTLLKELEALGVDNHVVCKSGGTLPGRLRDFGISHSTCDAPVQWLPFTAGKLGKIIDDFGPDLIHTRLSSAARIGGWWGKRKNVPVVETVDKYPKAHYHKDASWLIACSESVREHMLNIGFNGDRVTVVHNPIDAALYKRDDAMRASLRAKCNISDEQTVIIAAGRFVDWKGFDILLRAYAECIKDDQQFADKTRLLLLGDGEEKDKLCELADLLKLGQTLIMPGFVQNIRPYLWASDLFVLPSKLPEPFGIVLLEAMASGLAPIATCAGGPLDMVEDGKNGWLVPTGNFNALSAKLRMAVADNALRGKISTAAQDTTARFNVKHIAAQTLALYEKIISEYLLCLQR